VSHGFLRLLAKFHAVRRTAREGGIAGLLGFFAIRSTKRCKATMIDHSYIEARESYC